MGGTLNVLEEAARKDIKRFVYASSIAVYGELTGDADGKETSKQCCFRLISWCV